MLAFLDRDIYDNSSRTGTIFLLLLLFFPRGKEEKGSRPTSLSLSPTHSISPLHPTTSSLPIIPIIITTTPFLLPPLPNIPIIHSCSSDFHCLFPRKTPLVPYPPSKKETKDKSRNFVINGTYRNLLPQKINIIFTIGQTLLCRFKFGNEEGFGFREGVGEHDVCLFKLWKKKILACGCEKEKKNKREGDDMGRGTYAKP